jgi:hypothetical protein
MQYLGNVLTKQFGLAPDMHEEFAKTFRENCKYLGITSGPITPEEDGDGTAKATVPETVTLSEGAPLRSSPRSSSCRL